MIERKNDNDNRDPPGKQGREFERKIKIMVAARGNNQSNPVEVRQRIGPAIRGLRQQQGLSLSDLAEQTQISVSYLSRLEKGRSVPSFTLLSRLGHVLGVDIGYFVQTEEEAQQVDTDLASLLEESSLPKSTWSEIFGLSIETRKALLKFMKDAAK